MSNMEFPEEGVKSVLNYGQIPLNVQSRMLEKMKALWDAAVAEFREKVDSLQMVHEAPNCVYKDEVLALLPKVESKACSDINCSQPHHGPKMYERLDDHGCAPGCDEPHLLSPNTRSEGNDPRQHIGQREYDKTSVATQGCECHPLDRRLKDRRAI